MKRVMNLSRLIFGVLIRDQIVLYIALAPALLALVYTLVMGQVGGSVINFAVSSSAPEALVEQLSLYGEVSTLKSDVDVERRVLQYDNVVGVMSQGGVPGLLFEGNEGDGFVASAKSIFAAALQGKKLDFEAKIVPSKGSVQMTLTYASVLLFALFASAAAVGMNIVAERESRTIKATAISPIRMLDFTLAIAVVTMVLSLLNSALSVMTMRRPELMPGMLLLALSSLPVGALIALIFGSLADNQISAIAAVKIIMPSCLIIPIASYFVPAQFKLLFAWLPIYWQFEAVLAMLSNALNPLHFALAFLTGAAWLAVLSPYFRKRLMLK